MSISLKTTSEVVEQFKWVVYSAKQCPDNKKDLEGVNLLHPRLVVRRHLRHLQTAVTTTVVTEDDAKDVETNL